MFLLGMTSIAETIVNERLFSFESIDDKLIVRIPEMMHPQYGMYTWPSAAVLAQYLWFNRKYLPSKNVLELSAGTALPGVVAAYCGANVTLSDTPTEPNSLKICRKSCELNNLNNVKVVGINWGTITKEIIEVNSLDYLLASDCFYDPHDFEDIIFTVAYILNRNSNCTFFCTYQVRSSDWTIEDLLIKWNLEYKNIPLASFEGDTSNIANSNLPGQSVVEMMEIKLKS